MQHARGTTSIAGVVSLLALFAAICVIFIGFVSFMEWREEVAMEKWTSATAVVERGDLEGTMRKGSDPTYFHLRYRVHFDVNGQRQVAAVSSHSTPDTEVIDAMRAWAEQHRPGSEVAIRYDPAQPASAVFDASRTPGAGSRTGSNLTLLAIALGGCCVLFPLARFLSSRERARPVEAVDTTTPGHSMGWGMFCMALGFFIIAMGTYRVLTATGGYGADAILVAPIGLVFIFAGVMLALPPEREQLRRVTGALLITAFAFAFDWVAFGPGERQFGSAISAGALTVSAGHPGEWLGRALFGIVGLVATGVAIVSWLRLAR